MTAKGRKKGSGYRSQSSILLCLIGEPKSSLEIRQLTRLNKNTVCFNLRILRGIKTVNVERRGRGIFYQLDENPFFKWVIFHAFIGSRWAVRALRSIRRVFLDLPLATRQIGEMYSLVRKYRAQYKALEKEFPELGRLDVLGAVDLMRQIRFVKAAKKYQTVSATPKLRHDYRRDKLAKRHAEFAELCREFDAEWENLAGYVLFTIYCQFLKNFFPEVIDFAEKHRIKDYADLSFKLAAEFDELVIQLVEKRRKRIDKFIQKLKNDIDDVYEFSVEVLGDRQASASQGFYVNEEFSF